MGVSGASSDALFLLRKDKYSVANSFSDLINNQLELSYAPPQNFFFTSVLTPDLVFTAQKVAIPQLSIGEVPLPNYQNDYSKLPGDTMDYGTLDLTFLVDKAWITYYSLVQWMKGVVNPEAFSQNYSWITNNSSGNLVQGVNWQNGTADLYVYATDPALKPLMQWKFWNAYPISLEGPEFDSTDQDTNYLTSRVSFRYLYFTLTQYDNGAAITSSQI